MDWIVESAKELWRDDGWRIAALLLVPTMLVSLIVDSPLNVLVGGAAVVALLMISMKQVGTLRKGDPHDPDADR